jgi:hypothetical protein
VVVGEPPIADESAVPMPSANNARPMQEMTSSL